jgi:5-methylcytosine-specific restriction endonuclease McrA
VPRKVEKQAKRKRSSEVIRRVREQVFRRDARCRVCGEVEGFVRHHMHEIVYRSHTRGRPPEQRFNTKNCLRVCESCHHRLHARQVQVVFCDPELGANGRLDIVTD